MLTPKLICIQDNRPPIQSDLENILLLGMTLNLSSKIPMEKDLVSGKNATPSNSTGPSASLCC